MKRSHAIGTCIIGAALLMHAAPVGACISPPVALHRVDPHLATTDTSAPTSPSVLTATASRRSGLTCGQESCVENSCGDTGTMTIDLEAARDDQTPPELMGYRLELVDGFVPPSLEELIAVDLAAGSPLILALAFDEVPSIEAVLRLVAIDAAGNVSSPSAPFALAFDGCTLAAVGERCEHEFDPDGDLVYGFDAPPLEAEPVPAGRIGEASGCSVGRVAGTGSSALVLSMALGAFAALRRWNRERAAPHSCERRASSEPH